MTDRYIVPYATDRSQLAFLFSFIVSIADNTDVRIAVYNVAAEPGKELKFENDTPVFWEGTVLCFEIFSQRNCNITIML